MGTEPSPLAGRRGRCLHAGAARRTLRGAHEAHCSPGLEAREPLRNAGGAAQGPRFRDRAFTRGLSHTHHLPGRPRNTGLHAAGASAGSCNVVLRGGPPLGSGPGLFANLEVVACSSRARHLEFPAANRTRRDDPEDPKTVSARRHPHGGSRARTGLSQAFAGRSVLPRLRRSVGGEQRVALKPTVLSSQWHRDVGLRRESVVVARSNPAARQQVVDAASRVILHASKDVGQVLEGIDPARLASRH